MDPAAAAKWPDLAASHPAHGDLVAKFARFEVDLGPLSDEDRFAIASVLSRTATMADAQALHVIAGCLREDRAVDVDVSGMTMEARRTALMALGSAAHGPKTPANLSGAISRLLRAWESWLDLQLPSPGADRRTEAERLAEARTRSLQGRERPV